ncbi:MAG TPA: hypothetical protein P5547_14095, partial [Spirochaetota bacterium]|nr:hypothetical protein [Spirochaetota bacterium]
MDVPCQAHALEKWFVIFPNNEKLILIDKIDFNGSYHSHFSIYKDAELNIDQMLPGGIITFLFLVELLQVFVLFLQNIDRGELRPG